MIRELGPLTITTSGSAGSATGSGTTDDTMAGLILAMDVDYGAAPATTVLTISEVGGAGRQLFVTAAGNTDGRKTPRVQSEKAADGTASGQYHEIPVGGRKLQVAVSGADDANSITVRFIVQED